MVKYEFKKSNQQFQCQRATESINPFQSNNQTHQFRLKSTIQKNKKLNRFIHFIKIITLAFINST